MIMGTYIAKWVPSGFVSYNLLISLYFKNKTLRVTVHFTYIYVKFPLFPHKNV